MKKNTLKSKKKTHTPFNFCHSSHFFFFRAINIMWKKTTCYKINWKKIHSKKKIKQKKGVLDQNY